MALDLILLNCVVRNYDGSIDQAPQLGLLYIATLAKSKGYEVRILAGDDLFSPLLESIGPSDSPLVGFYLNSDNYHEVLRLSQRLRGSLPHIRTIVGGPLANVRHQDLVAQHSIDFACSGDGEFLVLELLESLKRGEPQLNQIQGLTFKSEEGEVIQNPSRPLIFDLDQLPIPDRSLYPIVQASIKSQLVTSRGCGFRCTFCFESTNRKYRAHSPERVIEEMDALKQAFGTTYFAFTDDIFTQNPKRLAAICRLLCDNFRPHEDLFWYCEARVDQLSKNPHLLPMMKEAGLTRIQIGTESGSQEVIDAYKKQISLEQIYRVVEQANDCGILSVFTNFIIGGALEDEKTVVQTIELAKELIHLAPGRFECNHTFLSPYPGTDVARRPAAYRLKIVDQDFETGLSDDSIFCETEALDRESILAFGRLFDEQTVAEMLRIAPTLSDDLILQHLDMFKHNLATDWAELLSDDPIIQNCAKFLQNGSYKRKFEPGEEDPRSIIPVRTFSLTSVQTGALVWRDRRRTVDFSDYELFLVNQCAGKLTLDDIVNRAHRYWDGAVPRDEIQSGVIDYVNALAKELLLVFRSVPISYSPRPLVLDRTASTTVQGIPALPDKERHSRGSRLREATQ